MRFNILVAALLPSVIAAKPLKRPLTVVAQLEVGTWFENIAARPNGDLLVTSLNEGPGLYTIRDPSSPDAELELIVPAEDLDDANLVLGLAQIETDDKLETFGIVAGRAAGLGQFEPGSYSIWTVKFPKPKCGTGVKVKKITNGTESSALLNGMTAIPGVPNVALVADSGGLVARVDLNTGAFDDKSFAFPDTMSPLPDAALPIGVNGVHVRNKYLYWTNSNTATIYRVRITEDGYPKPKAEPETVVDLAKYSTLIDDFTFDGKGNIYVAAFDVNSVLRVDAKSGNVEVVAGGVDKLVVPGTTAVAFGRGNKHERRTLYVTTSGGLAGPVNGEVEGAKVVAIRTGGRS